MHPFHQHGEHKKGHERAKHILKSGGAAHSDAVADKKLFSKLIAEHDRGESNVEGRKNPSRFARGGKVKRKGGHQTNIAIVVPQKGGSPTTPSPEPQAGPAGLPPGLPSGPAPTSMPPPGGVPPMPMRASGGRIDGGSTKENIKKWGERTKSNSYARGGRLPTAGAMSGEGRLQKAHMKGR